MQDWLSVALGGALGTMARLGITTLVTRAGPPTHYATMVVNLVGCSVVGALGGLIASGRLPMGPTWRLFLFVGLLGGFTTFSAFGLETFALARDGRYPEAAVNVAAQVLLGLAAVAVSFSAALRLSH